MPPCSIFRSVFFSTISQSLRPCHRNVVVICHPSCCALEIKKGRKKNDKLSLATLVFVIRVPTNVKAATRRDDIHGLIPSFWRRPKRLPANIIGHLRQANYPTISQGSRRDSVHPSMAFAYSLQPSPARRRDIRSHSQSEIETSPVFPIRHYFERSFQVAFVSPRPHDSLPLHRRHAGRGLHSQRRIHHATARRNGRSGRLTLPLPALADRSRGRGARSHDEPGRILGRRRGRAVPVRKQRPQVEKRERRKQSQRRECCLCDTCGLGVCSRLV